MCFPLWFEAQPQTKALSISVGHFGKDGLTAHQAAQPPLSVVFGHRGCYNLHMPKKDADDKDREKERGEHKEKSKEQQSTSAEDREKRKLPEPPGNLRRRAEWFKKRH